MSRRLRVLVGAIGLAGHTLPALALAAELRRRGHEVDFHGDERWRPAVEPLGIAFSRQAGLTEGSDRSEPRPALAQTARALAAAISERRSDAVVGDALTLSPLLAAEMEGVPQVRLLPEVYPVQGKGLPPFSVGLLPPRTAVGRAFWGALEAPLATRMPSTGWLRESHRALNRERAELGLAAHARVNEAPAGQLTLVATLPELEYPRAWPRGVHVVGPLFFDPPADRRPLPDPGDPLVLVAPSTVKDPAGRLIATTLAALRDEPVGVLVTTGGASPPAAPAPANAAVVDWVDYEAAMRRAAVVLCHGNHGTVTRALCAGVPLVISPAMPDDAEHGARVAWAGAGAMVPMRLLSERSLRAALRAVLTDRRYANRAGAIAERAASRDAAAVAADLVEAHARGGR